MSFTELARQAGLSVSAVHQRVRKLEQDGVIKGYVAVFDPDAEFVVTKEKLHYRHAISPYLGEKLRGAVKATYLRGRAVFAQGEFPGEPSGKEFRK